MEEAVGNANTGQTLKESFTSLFSNVKDVQENNVGVPKAVSTEKQKSQLFRRSPDMGYS